MNLPTAIDALLPQTQCTRCGYPTCRAYAEAIAADEADIDRCPPGGEEGVVALAQLLGRAPKPLNPVYGSATPPVVAFIDEDVCIGCTKCILACPVDAIIGAAKRMHTILTTECTGCELCVAPCPVDCIAMLPLSEHPLARAEVLDRATHARRRFDARQARLSRAKRNSTRRAADAALKPFPSRGASGGDGVVRTALPRAGERQPTDMQTGLQGQDAPRLAGDSVADAATTIAAEAAPTTTATHEASPISRSAVLEAIARGKARRAALKEPSSQ